VSETGPSTAAPEVAVPQVSVILPAHNEVSLLGSTVTNLVTGLDLRPRTYEIVIIENGSRDGTLRLARVLAAQFPKVRVLTLGVGDYGAALEAGFSAARGEIVASFDVDYYDLAFFDAALARIDGGADIVLASKRAPGASDDRPVLRRVLTAGFTTVLRFALGLQVSDAHGMKVYRRAPLVPLVALCSMRASMFDVELVLRAEHAELKIDEIPARVFERRPPRTPVGRRTIESLVGIVQLRLVLATERAGLERLSLGGVLARATQAVYRLGRERIPRSR
jgi:glycosyltransferase involved in cell wall biosynthesis